LIAEAVVGITMAARASDLAETVHPHPSLAETIMEAAQVFYGESTSVYRPKR
jgi:dihydrolipoamide dehydrogenase